MRNNFQFSIFNFKWSLVVMLACCVVALPLNVDAQTATGSAVPTKAATPTKTATSSADIVNREIQNLKEKIATRVAEIRKKNLKAVAGVVQENTKKIIKIKTVDEEVLQIKLDPDLTKYYLISGLTKKETKVDDVKKGAYIIVSGPQVDKEISANTVYQDDQYLVKSGKVTEVIADDNIVKVLTTEKDNYTLDIEIATKIQLLDPKTLEPTTVKYSKIKEGDTIHLVVKRTGTEQELHRYSADRLLVVPQEFFIK